MTLANKTCKLPEDGELTAKHVRVILNLRHLFVHMLVYNKQIYLLNSFPLVTLSNFCLATGKGPNSCLYSLTVPPL
jgi:hypothetical protein